MLMEKCCIFTQTTYILTQTTLKFPQSRKIINMFQKQEHFSMIPFFESLGLLPLVYIRSSCRLRKATSYSIFLSFSRSQPVIHRIPTAGEKGILYNLHETETNLRATKVYIKTMNSFFKLIFITNQIILSKYSIWILSEMVSKVCIFLISFTHWLAMA